MQRLLWRVWDVLPVTSIIDADGLHGVCNYTGLSAWHLGACAMRLAYDTYLVRVCMELYAIMGLTV